MNRNLRFIAEGIGRHAYPTEETPMLPDSSVTWVAHRVNELEGTIYLPAEPAKKVVAQLVRYARSPFEERWKCKRAGNQGSVTFSGKLAIKAFFSGAFDSGGLDALGANIALHEGLQRVEQPEGWRITAPEIVGAFVPDEEGFYPLPVWVMARAYGREPIFRRGMSILDKSGRSLEADTRRLACHAALKACGFSPDFVDIDGVEGNMMVRDNTPPEPSELVVFDVRSTRI